VHADPFGSAARQLSAPSSQLSEQFPSPSGPLQGSPVWVEQVPPLQVSVPLQNNPSVHADPFGSAAKQLSAPSSQLSEQLPSLSGPEHGSPACTEQLPPLQVSAPLQNSPSLHGAVLFGCWHTLDAPLH